MSRIRSTGTKIEKTVEKYLRSRKINFRPQYRAHGCRIDIAFPQKKIAVFVDGDFWHGWKYKKWRKRLGSDFWREKIDGNMARDKRVFARLRRNGWRVTRVWEHQLEGRSRVATLQKIEKYIKAKGVNSRK